MLAASDEKQRKSRLQTESIRCGDEIHARETCLGKAREGQPVTR